MPTEGNHLLTENSYSKRLPEHLNEHRPIVAFETHLEHNSPIVAIETHHEPDVHRPIVVESLAAIENRPIFVTPSSGVNLTFMFTRSFYTRRSPKRKKTVKLSVSSCTFGICVQKSCL